MTAIKSALDYFANGDRTGFLTGLVHSTRIMLTTFNEFKGVV